MGEEEEVEGKVFALSPAAAACLSSQKEKKTKRSTKSSIKRNIMTIKSQPKSFFSLIKLKN
jgi:hypothetical protein